MSAARPLAAGAFALALALVPWHLNPLYRLAGGRGDGPDPQFDVPLDPRPLRTACALARPTYYVDATTETPLAQGNAKAAGQLYLACGLPVQAPQRAEVTLRLRNGHVQLLVRID